jgi:hypothetical protein
MLAVLGAFFDDSGTHTSSPAVVIGGLLGTDEQWDAFEAAWTARLAHPLPGKPPLNQFHLSPCRAKEGEFRDYSQAESDRITYLFRRIILDLGFVTLAAAVNRSAWNELVVGDIEDELGQPEGLCFFKCIELVINTIRFRKPGQQVFIFFDQGTKTQLDGWARLYRGQSQQFPEIAGISFAPVPKVVALQGADMIATETYQYALEWLKAGENAVANAHFREYLKRELSTGLVFDRAQIAEIVTRVHETLAHSSGLTQSFGARG